MRSSAPYSPAWRGAEEYCPIVNNCWANEVVLIFFMRHQWRSRARRFWGRGRVRISRREMLFDIVSIVPQPPGVRGGKRHCRPARGSRGRLLLSAPWSGVPGADAPGSFVSRPGGRGALAELKARRLLPTFLRCRRKVGLGSGVKGQTT